MGFVVFIIAAMIPPGALLAGTVRAWRKLSHDGELGGGVVIVDPVRMRNDIWVAADYAGAASR